MLEDILALLFIICRQLPLSWVRCYVFNRQLRWGRRIYWLAVAAGMAAEFAVYLAAGKDMLGWSLYVFPLLYILIAFIMIKGYYKKQLIVCLAMDNFFVVVQTLLLLLIAENNGFWPLYLAPDLCLLLLAAGLHNRVRRFIDRNREAFFEVRTPMIINSVIIILLTNLLVLVLMRDYDKSVSWDVFFMRTLACLPIIWFLYLLGELVQEIKLNTQKSMQIQTMELLRKAEAGHYDSIVENWQNLRRMRHDLRHFILMMNEYLDSGAYDKLRSFLKGLAAANEQSSRVVLSGSTVLDALTGYWRQRAEQQGVELEAELRAPDLQVDDVYIAIIIGNLLENAVEAAARIAQDERRYVRLQVKVTGGMLLVRVENSFDGQIHQRDGHFYSAKLAFKQPGLGLENVRVIVERCAGYLDFSVEGKLFIASVGISNRKLLKDL